MFSGCSMLRTEISVGDFRKRPHENVGHGLEHRCLPRERKERQEGDPD